MEHTAAAARIFSAQNSSITNCMRFDLHALHVEEAVALVRLAGRLVGGACAASAPCTTHHTSLCCVGPCTTHQCAASAPAPHTCVLRQPPDIILCLRINPHTATSMLIRACALCFEAAHPARQAARVLALSPS